MSAVRQLSEAGLWEIFDLSPVSGSDLQSYLDLVLAKCAEWFRASGGSVFLEDSEGEYVLRSRIGPSATMPEGATIRIGEGIAGIVVATGIGRIVDDPLADPKFSGVLRNDRIKSAMVLPLIGSKGHKLGVLNLSRCDGESAFRKGDLEQAMALAAHVALAVANARLVSQLRRQVVEAEMATEKLESVLDSVAGAVVVVDSDGEVVNHNRAAALASFLTLSQDVDLSELQTVLMECTRGVLETKESVSGKATDAGSDRTWLVEALPIPSGGGVITVSEITDHERQQRELGRVKRLAEIGQMTAAVAHEIRNPLTGIRSAAQMIREHPETSGEFLELIEEESLRLNGLCDEFLDFARPAQLNLSPTSLAKVVESQVQLIRSEYAKKGVEIRGVWEDGEPTIMIDGRKIGQVVLNLLRNALEASATGGAVTVTVSGARLTVDDEGEGISREQLERLFSPFFTTKSNGTGLGLCTSRKIVYAHGGEITVDSEVGRGTRFEITLDRNLA